MFFTVFTTGKKRNEAQAARPSGTNQHAKRLLAGSTIPTAVVATHRHEKKNAIPTMQDCSKRNIVSYL